MDWILINISSPEFYSNKCIVSLAWPKSWVGSKPSGIDLLKCVPVAPQSWRGAHSWCVWATLWRRVLDSTKKAFFGRDETGNFLSHIFKLNSWKNNSNRLMTENCTVSSSSWGDRSGFQSECFTLCGCQVAVPLCPVDTPPACKHVKQGSTTSILNHH